MIEANNKKKHWYCIQETNIALLNKNIFDMQNDIRNHIDEFKEFRQDFEKFIDKLDKRYCSKRVEKVIIWFMSIVWTSLILWLISVIVFLIKLYARQW